MDQTLSNTATTSASLGTLNTPMKHRRRILILLVIAFLACAVLGFGTFIRQRPLVKMKTSSSDAGWSACPVAQGNILGDTIRCCIAETDTIIDLSFAWLKEQQIEAVLPLAMEFSEGYFRTYHDRTIAKGVGLTVAYVEPGEVKSVMMTTDTLSLLRNELNMRTWQFTGRDLSFSDVGGLSLVRIHFNKIRRGELQIRRSGGFTRIRIVV